MGNIIPLTTYVLYHSDFKEGYLCFEKIYKLLCRDPNQPLIDGIDIPVFFRTGNENESIFEIDYSISKFVVIFLLIDQEMYCSEIWSKYIEDLLFKQNDYIKVIPISLFKNAYEINSKLQEAQFISLKSGSFIDNWEEIKTRILDNLIRVIISKADKGPEKLKLFISHAKQDGEEIAKEFRNYLKADTKLDSFFDANDILEGHSFKNQIRDSVKNSLLVILKSDIYSEREWCKIEVLTAKHNDIPTIIVSNIQKVVKRSFPYIGNCPIIKHDGNWLNVVNLILKTALNQYYQSLLLETLNNNRYSKNYGILSNKPELFSFIKIKDQKQILYPEPPLGNEEIELLRIFKNDVTFYTPMQALAGITKYVEGKQIAISISEAEDMSYYGCSDMLIKDITLELSRHILIAGGKLVYGGDLRQNGFTKLFEDLSYQYGVLEKSGLATTYFTNYFAWPIHLNISKSVEADFKHDRVSIVRVDAPTECKETEKSIFIPPSTPESTYLWAKSLTKMRCEMENAIDARIILGGSLTNFKGKYAGIVEEFIIAKEKGHPIFILGGFGGAAKVIANLLVGKSDSLLKEKAYETIGYSDFVEYYNKNELLKIDYASILNNKYSISDLKNGLSDLENEILFHSTNIIEIVSLVLKGLRDVFEKNQN